jgi:hypothetical protein
MMPPKANETGSLLEQLITTNSTVENKACSPDVIFDDYEKQEVNLRGILEKLFLEYGRAFHPNLLMTMNSFHFPLYLQHFTNAHSALGLTSSADIMSSQWKIYLAIMAVSCYECGYLQAFLEEQFI